MAIHTSAITYSRGVPNNYNNFFFVSQANNVIPVPTSLYILGRQSLNRHKINLSRDRWPWNN